MPRPLRIRVKAATEEAAATEEEATEEEATVVMEVAGADMVNPQVDPARDLGKDPGEASRVGQAVLFTAAGAHWVVGRAWWLWAWRQRQRRELNFGDTEIMGILVLREIIHRHRRLPASLAIALGYHRN